MPMLNHTLPSKTKICGLWPGLRAAGTDFFLETYLPFNHFHYSYGTLGMFKVHMWFGLLFTLSIYCWKLISLHTAVTQVDAVVVTFWEWSWRRFTCFAAKGFETSLVTFLPKEQLFLLMCNRKNTSCSLLTELCFSHSVLFILFYFFSFSQCAPHSFIVFDGVITWTL